MQPENPPAVRKVCNRRLSAMSFSATAVFLRVKLRDSAASRKSPPPPPIFIFLIVNSIRSANIGIAAQPAAEDRRRSEASVSGGPRVLGDGSSRPARNPQVG